MSTSTRPGMAKPEAQVEQWSRETAQDAERVHYAHRVVGMHEVAKPLAEERAAGEGQGAQPLKQRAGVLDKTPETTRRQPRQRRPAMVAKRAGA